MLDIHATNTPAFIVSIDNDEMRFREMNAACIEQVRKRREDVVGNIVQNCVLPEVAEKIMSEYRACVTADAATSFDAEFVQVAGYQFFRTNLIPFVPRTTGQSASVLGFMQDCTREKILQRATEAFHERLSVAIGAIDGGFWMHDIASGEFETSRPLAELIAGPGRVTLGLAEFESHIHSGDLGLDALLEETTREYRMTIHDGRTRWFQIKRRIILNAGGTPAKVLGLVIDVTDQKAAYERLQREASTDALTSLANRRTFDRTAALAFSDMRSGADAVGLVLLDLDGFKPVNDRYGHRAGDEILRKVARRLARCVRHDDLLSRIGGDEFAILIRKSDGETGQALEKRIARAFEQPFTLAGQSIAVGISTGFALSTPDDASINALFERADTALYAMKTARNR